MDVLRAKLRSTAPLWAPLLLGLVLALGLVGLSRWLGFGGGYTVF
jgi:hypothetical protein